MQLNGLTKTTHSTQYRKTLVFQLLLLTLCTCFNVSKALADNHEKELSAEVYASYITETYLRTVFTFATDDKIKLAECIKARYYTTCTYVWVPELANDAIRLKNKIAPSENKLQIKYVLGRSQQYFGDVIKSYPDAEKVENIGQDASWSNKRKQLSFIHDSKLVIQITIHEKGALETKSKAVSIANKILEKL